MLEFLGKIIRKIKDWFRERGVEEAEVEELVREEEVSEMVSGFLQPDEINTWPIWDVLVTVFFWMLIIYAGYKLLCLIP
ncbi:hypothetical protein, partial [Klebsiella pneumoniae]|uniref:hypothetical protein n=1 Tax=Klebsiella pneumoniae TaxID=573 RepID=UPI0025A0F5A6